MDQLFREFGRAMADGNGNALAATLVPEGTAEQPYRLRNIFNGTNHHEAKSVIRRKITNNASALKNNEVTGWTEVYYALWKAIGQILPMEGGAPGGQDGAPASSWQRVYESWKDVLNAVHRGFTNYGFAAWTVPVLYTIGSYLRVFAGRADTERASAGGFDDKALLQDDYDADGEKNQQMEDCARQLNRLFQLCLSDRSNDILNTRKWGIYGLINLMFKTYFKLNSAALSRNVLKALAAYKGDMPGLDQFPKSQRVTFKYYEGVVYFLEENYDKAETHLAEAFRLCHRRALRNKERILTYLIPCHLITSHELPTKVLLEPYPRLQALFSDLATSIKKGDVHAFDRAMMAGEEEFVRRRIYLTLERARDIAMRNLLRKVFIAEGFEEPGPDPSKAPLRKTRIPLSHFAAGFAIGSDKNNLVDTDEVECYLANMIYKNLMKGYIHHERGYVILSKGGAFPGTGV